MISYPYNTREDLEADRTRLRLNLGTNLVSKIEDIAFKAIKQGCSTGGLVFAIPSGLISYGVNKDLISSFVATVVGYLVGAGIGVVIGIRSAKSSLISLADGDKDLEKKILKYVGLIDY